MCIFKPLSPINPAVEEYAGYRLLPADSSKQLEEFGTRAGALSCGEGHRYAARLFLLES